MEATDLKQGFSKMTARLAASQHLINFRSNNEFHDNIDTSNIEMYLFHIYFSPGQVRIDQGKYDDGPFFIQS